ncbi:bifunctional metallophosphatase/5'-nucleotidase [Aureibaculum sp. A20]|uniref:Bifunctional metallophosphatase/5'-nucleotidase n=1 Tax=Aureibaculum flavum TaxID=2795986 RepID=A0ABS0WWT7_9FLAO|nr:bifunctional UDP-sugar hydrolase/5'-nucleotidase [Aureibaculum flavum]MBJ2176458.1 bifunctional metallophosphatase/5'-nucleotidase [Aureibaculum flavum]
MKITVNSIPLEVYNGAKVKDAIVKYYSHQGKDSPKILPHVEDQYGNKVDTDGALTDGYTLFINTNHKKTCLFSTLLLTILTLILLFGCSTKKKVVTNIQGEKQAVIFAVNDMHAAIDNFPKLAFIVDSLRAIYPDMLLVSAGDIQTGNPVNDQYPEKGLPIIKLMNAVGFDLSSVGNHEFDTGPDGFRYLMEKANFDFICANVSMNDSNEKFVNPYKIIVLPNGLKLAFLGLLQINQNGIPDTHPKNVKEITFRSPFETAPEYLYLKDKSDVFIALTHLGFEDDVVLAETMPAGIDLIIGGHSHTKVEKEQIHNGIMITQAESKLKYGTLIKLNLLSDGTLQRNMKLIDIKNAKNEKPIIREMVNKYNDNPTLKKVISTAMDDFTSYEELGYLMADAQRDAAQADIALVNPGGVRIDHLAKGPITIMNVYQLDPFGNELVVTQLTGNEIHDLMLEAYPIDNKTPLYPSGIKTKLKRDANNDLLDITLLTESGSPLNMNKTYKVAMNNYMTQVYKYKHNDPGQSLFITTADATITYLKNIKKVKSYSKEKRVLIN